MNFNRVKLEHVVTFINVLAFMKYLTSVVSLIFLPETFIWNETTFLAPNLLNLVVNELMKSISKKTTIIPFST